MELLEKHKQELTINQETTLRIKVRPNAKTNEIKQMMADGTVKIDIAAVPEDGKANNELIKFLRQIFQVKKDQIAIISGQTAKLKIIKIKN